MTDKHFCKTDINELYIWTKNYKTKTKLKFYRSGIWICVFINLLTFMWLESALVVFCTAKWWKLSAKLLLSPFIFSSWLQIFPWHFSHRDLKKDWSYVMKYTCRDMLKKRGLEGRGYGIYVEFWFYGRKPRERSRGKKL